MSEHGGELEPERPKVGGWTKLFASMVHSSIWSEELHVRVVWVTMLAIADERGIVRASGKGLARAANVTPEQCFDALSVLSAPDADSRDPANEGRRVVRVDEGFMVLNHAKYRGFMTATERSRKHRATNATNATPRSDLICSSSLDQVLEGRVRTDQGARVPEGAQRGPSVASARPAASATGAAATPAEAVTNGHPRAGVYEPLAGPKSHKVPAYWQPKDYHREEAKFSKLDVPTELKAFRLHEFERAYSDWDAAFSRWLTKAARIAETDRFEKRRGKPSSAPDPMAREDDESHADYDARRMLGLTRAEYIERFGK